MFERRFFTQSKAALTCSIQVCVFVAHCDLKSNFDTNVIKLRNTKQCQGVNLIKLFWRKFTFNYSKLDHFMNMSNTCCIVMKRSSFVKRVN